MRCLRLSVYAKMSMTSGGLEICVGAVVSESQVGSGPAS